MDLGHTAFVFPGQGSQHLGMLDGVPELEALERLLDAAEALSGQDLRSLAVAGSIEQLADTRVSQPLLYLVDWAWGTTLLECGIRPVAVAGHSLGELAALAVAGVFSAEAGLELVVERSKAMAATAAVAPGTMAAVIGVDPELVAERIAAIAGVWVANDNAPGQIVISGTHEGVRHASAILSDAGARRIVPLSVSGPFHSPLMEPARAAFEEILAAAEFSDASIPVVQNTCPEPTRDADVIRTRLVAQITAPVRWRETMFALAGLGAARLVECGPGSVLAGLAKRVDDLQVISVDDAGIEGVCEEVAS